MVHFDFIGGGVLKNQIVINQVKNPILLACSSRSNKPAFEGRFLAENSILLIKATSFPAEILFLKILTGWWSGSHFFHPMGECISLMKNSKISPMWVKSSDFC
jgi:hypothetical protein